MATGSILGLSPPSLVQAQALGIAANNLNRYATPGAFKFRVNEGLLNTELRRQLPIRWEPVNRIGREPALQFLGPGTETIHIPGFLFPEDFGGFEMLERMRSEARQGLPRNLASVSGKYSGTWCITEITDIQKYFLPNGNPRKVEFQIELKAYGPDGASGFSIYI